MTVITQANGFGRRRLTHLPPMRPPPSSSWSTPVAPWILDQGRLSWHHTGPATRLSQHLLEARCSANRFAQTFGLSTITLSAIPDPLRTKSVFCSSMLPSPALGASASSIPPQKPLLALRPLCSECRVQWPVHGNSQRAVNCPFNTATAHTRYRATTLRLVTFPA